MAKELLRFSIYLLVFSLSLWVLHLGWVQIQSKAATVNLTLWHIHAFLGLLTFLGYLGLLFTHHRDATKTGFAYIGIGFLKMLASVLFLYPVIVSGSDAVMIDVLSFFVPYFLFLAFELRFVVRLLKKK